MRVCPALWGVSPPPIRAQNLSFCKLDISKTKVKRKKTETTSKVFYLENTCIYWYFPTSAKKFSKKSAAKTCHDRKKVLYIGCRRTTTAAAFLLILPIVGER